MGFGGKLSGFINTAEEQFEKRHLRAYIKGRKWFQCGFKADPTTGRKIPQFYEVLRTTKTGQNEKDNS
jgi:hypothetical protein